MHFFGVWAVSADVTDRMNDSYCLSIQSSLPIPDKRGVKEEEATMQATDDPLLVSRKYTEYPLVYVW